VDGCHHSSRHEPPGFFVYQFQGPFQVSGFLSDHLPLGAGYDYGIHCRGIASMAVVSYLPVIIAAGVLLGGGWGIALAILSVLSVLTMVLLGLHGLLPASRVVQSPLMLWVGYSMSAMLVAVMQYLAARQSHFAFEKLTLEVAERKKAEAEIQALNDSLEKKVAERTTELQEANHSLETFNYSVSHDLQSPLRLVNGYAKILLKDYDDKLDDEGKHLLQSIHTNMSHMSRLVKDLLEFSRSGRVALAMEPVDMNEMVASIIDEVKKGEERPTAEIIVHDLDGSISDSHLIRQVWINLISNSIKFSCKRETPMIEIGTHVTEDQRVYYIRDNGVGFDMQYAPKLFDPFHRLHPKSEFEGSGIGLATAQRIISRHGGKIWADAKLNEGATFYFTIPIDGV
jgi:signal transduction histidine kinase